MREDLEYGHRLIDGVEEGIDVEFRAELLPHLPVAVGRIAGRSQDAGARLFRRKAEVSDKNVGGGNGCMRQGVACGYAELKCVSNSSSVRSQRRDASSAIRL